MAPRGLQPERCLCPHDNARPDCWTIAEAALRLLTAFCGSADDDGAVVVPAKMASELANTGGSHSDWEVWVRMKLAEGGHLRDYYGRKAWSKETDDEYKKWCNENDIEYHPLDE